MRPLHEENADRWLLSRVAGVRHAVQRRAPGSGLLDRAAHGFDAHAAPACGGGMTLRWHVAQSERNYEVAAAVAAIGHGFESYLPVLPTMRKIGRKMLPFSAPRFGVYFFIKFDRDQSGWESMLHERGTVCRIKRILCDPGGRPSPVPELAIMAIRDYQPPKVVSPEQRRYIPGEPVICIIAGTRKEAVFVEYCGGNRPMVRTWIFGAERVTEVTSAEIEPVEPFLTIAEA